MLGRSCTAAPGVLRSLNQPSGGLAQNGSEHAVVRIYSGKEKGEKIMDVGSPSSTFSSRACPQLPFVHPDKP